jgi:hypothetical protein
VRLDDVNLRQRGDDQQLQPEPGEEGQREAGGLVGPAAEGLVDDDEAEGRRPRGRGVEAELVGQLGREGGVGELR